MPQPRQTRQREVLREIIERSERPLSPNELLDAARKELDSVSLSTVYRTLKLFVEEGIAAEVNLPGQTPRYERADRGHHHHFHCDACDRAFDLNVCPGDAIAKMAPPGFTVSDHDITLYGTCDACSPAKKKSRSAAAKR